MANTYAAALVVDRLAESAITVLGNKLAPLRAFSRDFGTDSLRPRATVQVQSTATTSTAAANPTNYESGDSTSTAVAVSVDELNASFHVGSQDLMQGQRLETIAAANLHSLGDLIWDKCVANFNDSTGGSNTKIAVAQASFAAANREAAWASIAKGSEKHLILDGTAYSQNLPTDRNSFDLSQNGAFGFDGIHLATKWDGSGGESNLYGVAAAPNGLAVAAGLPEISGAVANNLEEVGTVEIPDLGLTVQTCLWGSTSSRATWASYGVMFGAAKGDVTAFTCIVSS